MDVDVSFETSADKNIAMVLAPNGGGKTEMLYSFQWVLYNFDFKKLKSKENTPYSLNSVLYQKLENGQGTGKESCSVTLCFEADGCDYTIRREELFEKQSDHIKQSQSVSLYQTKPNGETTPPIVDMQTVKSILRRVVPEKLLSGIVFDGERMKKLSNTDEDTKAAVEGVIRLITNEELFDICRREFQEYKKELDKDCRKIGKNGGNTQLVSITDLIGQLEDLIKEDRIARQAIEEQIEVDKTKLNEIHSELEQLHEAKELEIQRDKLRHDLKVKGEDLAEKIDLFGKDLNDGYLLLILPLVEQVYDALEQHDVPAGLTTEAVKSILQRDTCICGSCMTEDIRQKLTSMLSTLPPDNINSTIHEIARQMGLSKNEAREKILRTYQQMYKVESEIIKIKSELSVISSQISGGVSERAKDLELENLKIGQRLSEYENKLDALIDKISSEENKLKDLEKKKTNIAQTNLVASVLDEKSKLMEKFCRALDDIDEWNKVQSLHAINKYLAEAYDLISEDTGRSIRILQFENSKKYSLHPYSIERYNETYEKLMQDGTISSWEMMGLPKEQIEEQVIIKTNQSSSTGQGKINALAFAKAILQYSSEPRNEQDTAISKVYPLLIDSPFTELSGENLQKSALEIHNFSEQVILMISDESLKSVIESIKPYVHHVTELGKDVSKSYSYVK